MYSFDKTPICSTPKRGKATKGIKAVAGRGRASVAHQIPIKTKIAAVICPLFDKSSGLKKNKTTKKSINPAQNPIFF